MDKIYNIDRTQLGTLLDECGDTTGATLLVPNLQRPFVWTPIQVIRLVDTLLRGWPFGTLLLWKIDQGASDARIPSRPFWTVENRTAEGDSTSHHLRDAPARYRMVLDGQQRLQSLLIAFGADGNGFKLTDRDWFQGLTDGDTRKGRWSDKHWSRASLFIDVLDFTAQFQKAGSPRSVDYESCLSWVAPDASCRSLTKQGGNYIFPVLLRPEHTGRFVRFSRLWQMAGRDGSTTRQLKEPISALLDEYQAPAETRTGDVEALAELVIHLHAIKTGDVSYLELQPYSRGLGSPDEYNDAVVNIFARLNKGGRALTDQEITYAWIKSNWDERKTGGRQADQCFNRLREELTEQWIGLTEDQIVRTASACWSAQCDSGQLLGKGDMLRPDKVKRLAADLCDRWDRVTAAAYETAQVLKDAGLRYGEHYESLNAIIVLVAWRSVGAEWAGGRSLNVTQRDSFVKQLRDGLARECARWLAVTEWGQAWSGSAGRQFKGMIEDLSQLAASVANETNPSVVARRLTDILTDWLTPLVPAATEIIDRLQAPDRNQVVVYYLPLWVWHRLDPVRWTESQVILKDLTKRTRPVYNVDHIVPCRWWESQADTMPEAERDARKATGNQIGNCWLMMTDFNKSKSAEALAGFLARVHEFRQGGGRSVSAWAATFGITTPFLDAPVAGADAARLAIITRTREIKDELKAFVRGEKYPAGST